MLAALLIAIAAGAVASLAWFVNDVLVKRRKLAGYPQPPMKNLLLGHLHIADECAKVFPKGIHTHTWADYMREKWKLPETFYIDWRPFGPLWLFSADPELMTEYVLYKQNLPKSKLETDYLDRFLGSNNLVSLEGSHHKNLRTIFNPGFSANNIMTYTDAIVDATLRFIDVLKEKAKTHELIEMEEYATRLTIDIIGVAVFDTDMQAQSKLHPIVQHFRERVPMMPGADAIFPWQDIQPTRPFRLWWNNRKLEAAINLELDLKIQRRAKDMEAETRGNMKAPKKRSIIDLALSSYEKEITMGVNITGGDAISTITDSKSMPVMLRKDLVDSIKTFFFAGHDTTSSTISWCYYLLHRNPEAQAKLIAELDHFFPPGKSAADTIKKDPYIINKLEYTTACIKETMRIFPPASSVRETNSKYPAAHSTFTDPRTGQTLFLDGTDIWPMPHMMSRNTRFFPKPTQFIPDRFIPSRTPFPKAELFEPAGKYAFQPFSIGPRNCIGQELAMIEGKIVLALTARQFDFVLEYPGEQADPQPSIPESSAAELAGQPEYYRGLMDGTRKHDNVVEGHRVWQTLKGSAKPVGGCPGRIKLR